MINSDKRLRRIRARRRLIITITIMLLGLIAGIIAGFQLIRSGVVSASEYEAIEEPPQTPVAEEIVMPDINTLNVVSTVEEVIEEPKYTQDDLMLLARLIESEAGIEKYEGKLAVGTVVMNRMEHYNKKLFGGPTLSGVIYHKITPKSKYQFDGVTTDEFKRQPSEDSLKASKEVLEGHRSFRASIVYYYNPKISTDKSFIASINPVVNIGRHTFAENK